jgi:sporulation protein YunB
MEMVTADSMAINRLIAEISLNIQKAFKNMQSEYMYIPFGSLMGSKLFSQAGPQIKVNIVPISVTSSDFRTEFEEQGINQTKYMLYIILGCEIKVLCPFAYDTIETSTKVLIAEAVILGKVPSSYVQVPEEDILDVTEQ